MMSVYRSLSDWGSIRVKASSCSFWFVASEAQPRWSSAQVCGRCPVPKMHGCIGGDDLDVHRCCRKTLELKWQTDRSTGYMFAVYLHMLLVSRVRQHPTFPMFAWLVDQVNYDSIMKRLAVLSKTHADCNDCRPWQRKKPAGIKVWKNGSSLKATAMPLAWRNWRMALSMLHLPRRLRLEVSVPWIFLSFLRFL